MHATMCSLVSGITRCHLLLNLAFLTCYPTQIINKYGEKHYLAAAEACKSVNIYDAVAAEILQLEANAERDRKNGKTPKAVPRR